MRVVFMGTPDFAVASLSAVAAVHEVALVVTRPDAVRGRGSELLPSPVKARALELGIPVLETKRMTPEAIEAVRQAAPDVICVVAFGCILPDEVLEVAPLGAVNVHASLLPRWRGAAPIQRSILEGTSARASPSCAWPTSLTPAPGAAESASRLARRTRLRSRPSSRSWRRGAGGSAAGAGGPRGDLARAGRVPGHLCP